MGLSVVHGLVEDHNGAIKVNSKKGCGTTFHLAFPVAQEPEAAIESPGTVLPLGTDKIVLVDDDPFILDAMEEMLLSLGYNVVKCRSAEQALGFLESSPEVELVITDQVIASVSGGVFIRRARKYFPNLPILLLCDDFVNPLQGQETSEPGVLTIYFKPMRMEQLALYVRKALAGITR